MARSIVTDEEIIAHIEELESRGEKVSVRLVCSALHVANRRVLEILRNRQTSRLEGKQVIQEEVVIPESFNRAVRLLIQEISSIAEKNIKEELREALDREAEAIEQRDEATTRADEECVNRQGAEAKLTEAELRLKEAERIANEAKQKLSETESKLNKAIAEKQELALVRSKEEGRLEVMERQVNDLQKDLEEKNKIIGSLEHSVENYKKSYKNLSDENAELKRQIEATVTKVKRVSKKSDV